MSESKGVTLIRDTKKIVIIGAPETDPAWERIEKLLKEAKKKVTEMRHAEIVICLLGVWNEDYRSLAGTLYIAGRNNQPVIGVLVHDAINLPGGIPLFDLVQERDLWIAFTGNNPLPYRFHLLLGKLYGKYENENINKILEPFGDHLGKLVGANPNLTVDEALHVGVPSAHLVSADEFLGLPTNMTCVTRGADEGGRNYSYNDIRNHLLAKLSTPFVLAIDVVPKNPDAKIEPTGDLIEPEQLAVIQEIEATLEGQKLTFNDYWDEKPYFNTYCAVNKQVVFLGINGNETGRTTPIKLTKLPESLGKLKSLRYLWLTDVEIEELPPSFENLENLKELSILQTKLKRIVGLQKMGQLWRLNASANRLEEIPPDIIFCPKLVLVDFLYNPLNEADYTLNQDAVTYGIDQKQNLSGAGIARVMLELRQRATMKDPALQLPPLPDFISKNKANISLKHRCTEEWIKSPYLVSDMGVLTTIALGNALVAMGLYDDFLQLLEAFKEKIPQYPNIAEKLNFEYVVKNGDPHEALQIAQRIDANLTEKEHAPQPELLVRAYIRCRDWDNAFKKLQEMDNNQGIYYYYGGIISVGNKMYDQAIESLTYARDHWSDGYGRYTPEKAQTWINNVGKMKQSPA